MVAGKNLKEGLIALEEDLAKLSDKLQQEAQSIPNMTHPDVPIGGEDCSTIRKMVFQLLQFLSFIRCSGNILFSSNINNVLCDFLGWQLSQI